jgi:DNA-binding transcriptional LysR family regulator
MGKPVRVEFRPTLNSNSGEFLLSATLQQMGIALLPDFLCRPAISCGQLVPVLSELSLPSWGIFLIHAVGRQLNQRMRLISEELEAACVSSTL